jgi:hypothetical protein
MGLADFVGCQVSFWRYQLAKIQENKRKFADKTPGVGGESPMCLPMDAFKALFARPGQLWRTAADRFPALGQWTVNTPETLQATRNLQMVWTWGCDCVAGRSCGGPLMIVGNVRHA